MIIRQSAKLLTEYSAIEHHLGTKKKDSRESVKKPEDAGDFLHRLKWSAHSLLTIIRARLLP